MACRALARMWCWDFTGDSYSGWIIAGCASSRVGGCRKALTGFGRRSLGFRSKEGENQTKCLQNSMPLLRQRVVMRSPFLDVGEEGLLRVNVIPRKLEGSADENGALTVPLSITGKAEELDRELPAQLTSFTESVTKTGSNIDELRTQHAAAVKAVEAENKKKIDDKKKGNGSRTPNTPSANSRLQLRISRTASRCSGPKRHQCRWKTGACSTLQRRRRRPRRWLLAVAPLRQCPSRNILTNQRAPIPIDTRERRERGLRINDHRNHGPGIPL